MPNNDSHQHVVKTSEQWNERIVEFWVVPRGCLCVELTPRGKTKLKIGEGNKYYSQLPYICDDDLSQYYTKTEVDNLLENFNRMAIMSTEEYDEKSDLPLTGNKLGDVRFVKSQNPSIKIDPDIYLWNGSRWVFAGDKFPDIDLSKYLKKTEFHELFDPVSEKVDEMYPMRHTHENKAVLDQITAPFTVPEKEKLAGLENYDDTEIRELIQETGHTHPNKELLDTITSDSLWSNSDRDKFDSLHNYDDTEVKVRIETLESKSHTHENKEILDQITAPFTTEDKTKLDSLHNDEVFRGTDGMYPGTSGNVPAPSTLDIGKFLSSDGTWKPAGYDIDFIGATPYADGVHGLVPAPLMGEQSYFLRGDGTWAKIKSGGDKYKAGEGIYILSGEATSDTFPFEVYSRAETLKQYIIYGNVGGVGNPVGSSYHIPVVISAPGHPNRTSTIVIDDPMYDGDYIDFEKQVFAHYRTDITSQIRHPDTDETQRGINYEGVIYYKRAYEGWGGAPRISDYFEIDPNASYEISPVHSDSDFYDSLNVNVYDENHNRTRTIITSTTDATLFVPMPGEKYIRQSYVGDTGLLSLLKPVETPCVLQNVVLYPNAINTIDVDTSIKPREIYVEVDEPIDPDPDDPMSQYSGIIYNDGVIDVTQDDPNNMNVLTFHYRDDVTKDITIDTGVSECVVDITQEDPTNLNELTISYADGTTNVITIPGGSGSDYAAGDGIDISNSGSEIIVTNPAYYFDTQVQCELSGRTFTKYNTDPALGVIVYNQSGYTGPMFIGLTEDSVKVRQSHDSSIIGCRGSFEYLGYTWYYSNNGYWMSGNWTDSLGNIEKLPGSYPIATDAEMAILGQLIVNTAGVIPSDQKIISAKIGNGLMFDEDDAIRTTAIPANYVADDGIEFTQTIPPPTVDDWTADNAGYYFDNQVTCYLSRSYKKTYDGPALCCVMNMVLNGDPIYDMFLVSPVLQNVTFECNGNVFVPSSSNYVMYKGLKWYYSNWEYAWGGTSGTDTSGNLISLPLSGGTPPTTFADAALLLLQTADVIGVEYGATTYGISAKIGEGLQFDANGAIETVSPIDDVEYVARSNTLTISKLDGTTVDVPVGGGGTTYEAGDGIEFTTSDLPSGYIQLEYVESFGSQSYIDTGVSHGFTAYMDLQYTASNHRQLMGLELSSGTYFGSNASEEFEMWFPITNSDTTQRTNVIWYHDEINPARLEVNGSSVTDVIGQSNKTFKIFSPFATDGFGSSVKIYSVDIYDNNNTLIRRFIPCQSPSNIVGMYDSVNDVFYPPTGTSLIAGRPLGDVTINAKLGNGLTFDSNDAIELDEATKFIFNCNNDNS